MKKVIVTGANGFIGNNVVRVLLRQGISVITVDLPECNNKLKDIDCFQIGADLSDPMNLLEYSSAIFSYDKECSPDTCFHFAWAGSAGNQRFDTNLQLRNVQNTIDALRVAKKLGCGKFVCAGTVMEEESYLAAYAQGCRPGLGYIYGSAKLAAHAMCMSVAADLGIDLCWAMITNAYGPGEISPRFINTTLRKIINGEPLQFTAATQNYDFVYIDDIAKAFYCIGENGKPFKKYLIGSGRPQQLKKFIVEMIDSVAPGYQIKFGDIPFTGINMPLDSFSTKDLVEDTGFCCDVPFGEGVLRTHSFLKETTSV